MKKFMILSALFALFSLSAFSNVGFEFGIGSGYVFYGDKDTKDFIKSIDNSNQTILCMDALFLIPMNNFVVFSLGGDSILDFRWKGGNHINLIDYAFLAGVKIFPNFGGLFVSVDYALGRRTDFISLEDYDGTKNTKWGNGFKFALGYDFSPHLQSNIGPVLAASLKSMPRGSSRDNQLCVSLKLTKHK